MNTPTPAPPNPLRNSYWVIPGKVLAGEHPNGTTVEATRERLQRLMDAGVECFIDLTEPGEVKPYDPELPFSVEYLRKPVRDHGIPAQRAHMAEILDCIHDALQSGRCVYIHCRAGIGRTGTVVGCLLVERGFEGEAALDELNRLWQHCERSQSWASVPETDDQVAYVRKWKARAVFAEELSLASAAARDALAGRSGTAAARDALAGRPGAAAARDALAGRPGAAPTSRSGIDSGSGAGSRAGAESSADAGALLGVGLRPGSATPGSPASQSGGTTVARSGSAAPGSQPGGAPLGSSATSSGAAAGGAAPGPGPTEPVLRGLGLPLLDDDDDDTSDFERFNSLTGAPTATQSAGTPPPATQPSDWPSFGKQPDTGARGTATPGRGAKAGRATIARGATPAGGARTSGGTPTAGGATMPRGPHTASGATLQGGTSAGVAPTAGGIPTAAATAAQGGTSAATQRSAPTASGAATASGAPIVGGTPTAGQGAHPGNAAPERGQPATAREPTPNTTTPATITPSVDDPLSDPAALAAARNLRDRFLGALLGLAVGDAVSAATQFRKAGTFTPVGDMIGGGPFDLPRGGWTDDTAMALCLADSLLERNGSDPRDQMERYRRWQQEGYLTSTGQCVGITASTARAIAMSAWRRGALFGSHDPTQLDPEPLSRVAPAVMFFFAASGQAVDQATEAARTTCQAPAVLDACRSLARALHAALSGQPKSLVLEKAVQAIGTGPSGPGPDGRTATRISASAALTAAVAAFAATANFRDAVLYAANLGGDSDVITAVCGQLAGAYYSVKAIPTSWHNGLMQKELITRYADRLLAHALLGLSG